MRQDDHQDRAVTIGYVIDDDGVTPSQFARVDGFLCVNADEIAMKPGGVIDFGGGLRLTREHLLDATVAASLRSSGWPGRGRRSVR